MKNYLKYASSKYFTYLGYISIIIGLIAVIPFPDNPNIIALITVIVCFVLAFIIPFIVAIKRNNFKIKTIGKSSVFFSFGNILEEECFVITTNLYFDVNPTGEWIASDSLLGIYVNRFFRNNIIALEQLIETQLGHINRPCRYGQTITIKHDNKLVYLLAFTDRNKANQPVDFYEKSLQGLFEYIVNENHNKTIAIPLIGDNNNLSASGLEDSEMTFKCLMAMINCFETRHPRSGLKIKIVALPEKRSELINIVDSYIK